MKAMTRCLLSGIEKAREVTCDMLAAQGGAAGSRRDEGYFS